MKKFKRISFISAIFIILSILIVNLMFKADTSGGITPTANNGVLNYKIRPTGNYNGRGYPCYIFNDNIYMEYNEMQPLPYNWLPKIGKAYPVPPGVIVNNYKIYSLQVALFGVISPKKAIAITGGKIYYQANYIASDKINFNGKIYYIALNCNKVGNEPIISIDNITKKIGSYKVICPRFILHFM